MKIPIGPEALTVEWLTDALRETGTIEKGRVESFDTQVLGGVKGALGQLARLNLDYDGGEEGVPRSLIAKFHAADPEARKSHNASGFYEREVRFYERLADQVEFRTPRCYYSTIDVETGEFVLLLEDLAPARNGDRAAGCSLQEAELAIREVAKFHAAWWENPRLAEIEWLLSLDSGTLQPFQGGYQQCWDPFVEKVGLDSAEPMLEIGQRFGKNVANVYDWHNKPPQTLLHFDYQLDNFFFGGAEGGAPFAVIDWQLLARGRGVFDVANFLGGNVSPAERRAHEGEFLRIYHSILVENGVKGYSFDQCWDDYRFSMFDGLLRMVLVIGGGSLRDEQERAHRDVIWPRFSTAILDLNVGELLPR